MPGLETLARMAGKALQIDYVPGGIPALTNEEVMGCLGGLDRGPELLVRAAVCQDPVMDDLGREAFHLAVSVAVREKWKPVKGKPVLRTLGMMAVEEIVNPQSLMCRYCGGTGRQRNNPKHPEAVCRRCGGTGNRAISARSMAARCEIDEAAWRRTWAPRYLIVRDEIYGWWWTASKHISRQLAREA